MGISALNREFEGFRSRGARDISPRRIRRIDAHIEVKTVIEQIEVDVIQGRLDDFDVDDDILAFRRNGEERLAHFVRSKRFAV